MIKQLLQRFN